MGNGSSRHHVIAFGAAQTRLGADLERVRKCFESLCKDVQNGKMDESQFCGAVFTSPVPNSVSRALFRQFDVEGGGKLSYADFVCGMALYLSGTEAERGQLLFNLYDVDGDGFVSVADVKSMLSVDLLTRAVQAQELGKLITTLAEEAVGEANPGLEAPQFIAWARKNMAISSLASWAFGTASKTAGGAGASAASASGSATSAAAAEGGQPAVLTESTREIDPLEAMLRTLKEAVTSADKTTVAEFLRKWGYVDDSKAPLSAIADDEKAVVRALAADERETTRRIAYAFLGMRPPNIQAERAVISWLQEQDRVQRQTSAAKLALPGKELEESMEIVMPGASSAGASDGTAPPPTPVEVKFLVASAWLKKWETASSSDGVGAIDNSVLIREGSFNVVKQGLHADTDYRAVIPVSWNALRSWYGGGPAVQRPYFRDIDVVEVYPLNCSLYVRFGSKPMDDSIKFFCDKMFKMTVSRKETVGSVKASLCSNLNFRLFFTRLWLIDAADSTFVLLDRETDSVTQSGIIEGTNLCLEVAFNDGTWPLDSDSRVKTVGVKSGGEATASLRQGGSLLIGLRNLGNTCYMNSALQCLLATPIFANPYFVKALHKKELCLDNPVGYGGRVAWSFGDLVSSIVNSTSDVVYPLEFKSQIGTCHAEFAGFRQHDAQEMLAWLLDALHEDVNRVIEKPYLQDPDDLDPNMPDAVLAEQFWANHKKRNNSVVVDLFHGQIKSTLRCTTCNHVSRKFDVFSTLGLPLPPEDMRLIEVLLHPNVAPAVPMRYGFRLQKNSKIIDLKRKIHDLTGHKPRAVALFSVWNSRHDRLFDNFDSLEAIRDNETVHAYVVHGTNKKLTLCNPPPRPQMVLSTGFEHMSDSDDDAAGCFGFLMGSGASSPNKKKGRKPNGGGKSAVSKIADPTKQQAQGGQGQGQAGQGQGQGQGQGSSADDKGKQDATDVDASDDEEQDAKTPGGVGMQRAALDYCYAQVVHRRVEKADGAPIFNPFTPRTFGVPLLLSVRVAEYNTEALYAMVWERVSHLISKDYETHKETSSKYPFRLSVVDHSGLSCAICHWTQYCVGCPLSDKLLDIERHLVLAIDWDIQVLRLYYNNDLANRSDNHASVQQNRSLQDYPISLHECLDLFGREEQLDDWYCGKCKELRTASKSLTLFRTPLVVCIHLKRFQFNRQRWEKVNKLVNFPVEGLALGEGRPFNLFATLNHFGGIGGGHYNAYTKFPGDNTWYYIDDSRFRKVDEPNMVVTRAAYCLFYAREDIGEKLTEVMAGVNANGPDLAPRQVGSRCVML